MAEMTNTLLDAGALVPIKTKIKNTDHVDEISARVYRHPGLGDRPVVRLSADKLAQGDDLEMEFLGFDSPEVVGPLAYRRRQALGFPGWALIHDPDHARYALELVKEFKKAARKAKAKPGHGYDAFVEIAKRLGKSVAHFLPSFWEQVGREFILIGNSTYASRAFGKAREAEKVHALKVDEKIRQDAFLEFALAGGLSNKALTEYGKELQTSLSGPEAWKIFRELCVRRTLGGMPPWTSLPNDVKPLITGAKLDVDAEMKLLLAEILESPAMNRAPMGFWKSCSSYIQELAATNDRVAGILLNLLPETSRWDKSDVWKWLELLDEWNVLPNAWKDGVSEDAGPHGGPAAWFSRLSTVSDEPPQRLFDILKSLAPKLKKDKKAVKISVEQWRSHTINVDLLDLALELKVPLEDPPEQVTLSLTDWARPGDDAKDRPRDPVFVHQHKVYGKLLEKAVPEAAGQAEFEAAAQGKSALAAARKNWLMGLIDQLESGGLPGAEIALNHLQGKTGRETYREFPEAYKKLQSIDLAPVLARTIAGGVIDEYGWPIVEQITEKLGKNGKQPVRIYGRFPYAMVTDGLKVVVVNTEEVVLEHELQIPKKAKLDDLMFYDGQLLVYYEMSSYQSKYYWSSNPKKTTECYHFAREQIGGAVVDLKDGGTFIGRKAVHAGDADNPDTPNHFLYDGEHFWKFDWFEGEYGLREVDPKTGKEGRRSRPSFFEDFLGTGDELIAGACQLLFLGDAVKNSPLGSKEGSIGWRVKKNKSGRVECEGIDGRSWKGKVTGQIEEDDDEYGDLDDKWPCAMVDQPGTSDRLLMMGSFGWDWGRGGCDLRDPSGKFSVAHWESEINDYNRGQVASFPPIFWHAFQVRDEKASKALRSINDAQAKKLLSAIDKDLEQSDEVEDPLADLPETESALKKWLAGVKNERLHRGIVGIVHKAGELADRLKDLIENSDPESTESFSSDPAIEALVQPAMKVFGLLTGWRDEVGPLFPHLGDVRAFIEGEKKSPIITPPPYPPFEWWELLNNLNCRIWQAYWSAEEKDDAWLKFLEHWADLGFPDLPGKFRQLEGSFDGAPPVKTSSKKREEDWIGHYYQGNVYFLAQEWDEDWRVFEYAPKGKFQLLPKYKIEEEHVFEPSWSGETIREFIAEARKNEKPFLDPEKLQALANRLGITPAEVGLVWFGFPNFNTWEKNFLPKELRERLKLKVGEADAARQSLKALPDEARRDLLKALLSGPPAELWADGSAKALERLTAAWEKIVPKRLSLPAKLMDQLTGAFPYHVNKGEMLVALASPKTHPLFTANAEWSYGKDKNSYWTELASKKKGQTFDGEVLTASAIAIPLLSYHLPVGDPARSELPDVHQAVLKCFKSEKLLLELIRRFEYDEKDKDAGKTLLEKTLGKKSTKHGEGWLADDGMILGYAEGYQTRLAFRPGKARSDKDYDRLAHLAKALYDEDEDPGEEMLDRIRLLRSEGYQAICDRIKKTPVPEGRYESNPEYSALDLVEKVEKKLGVSREAVVLYLEILALPDCTSANIKTWNNWSAAQFNKAGKELEKHELVLKAKRARAGRDYFLPGGWEALKIPHLPIETWKLPLFGITRNAQGGLDMPLPRILPLIPVHELFQKAWDRTQKGDAPRYEEVS